MRTLHHPLPRRVRLKRPRALPNGAGFLIALPLALAGWGVVGLVAASLHLI